MRIIVIIFILFFHANESYSQQLGFTTISPTAGSFDNGEVDFYFSIGEPFNHVVENEEVILSQGLLNMGDPDPVDKPITLPTFEIEGVQITAYPNPTLQSIQLESDKSLDEFSAKIIDINGNVMLKTKVSNNKHIDLQDIPSGIYILQLYNSSDKFSTIKLIKQ